ncbi:MAG: type II toxin-antitoxin system ParD family antitoxin [Symploca sp. SIO2E6]|nr:type II toxin-antitoxin system ParD family antitoxin [Symploca sp. SIO2E6]
MNISLTPQLEQFVDEQVASGTYFSASEVIRDGLRLLIEQQKLKELKITELRKEIAIGIEQADSGQFVDGEEVFENIKAKSSDRRRIQS